MKYMSPMGYFAPNAFGLYDRHGNVSGWAEDCRNGSYWGHPLTGARGLPRTARSALHMAAPRSALRRESFTLARGAGARQAPGL